MKHIKNILSTINNIACAIVAAIMFILSIPIFVVGMLLVYIAGLLVQCALYFIGE